MLQLLMSPRTARTVRGLIGTLADAVRSVTNPAALVERQAEPAPVEPAGLYTTDDMPPLESIEAAALGYDLAADSARSADRAKRKHRKLLDRLPAGTYGSWLVRRVSSSRQTVDLDAVRVIFKTHGLGDVPMRDTAPSLRVERIDTPAAVETLTEVTV
ncbi:hypothetical protein QF032_003766 [Streptomyces achromogenes]|uniref:hypothetical protein n=1 Tax=Streptomyces achromogenes TaxID=67255 RepID=UPI002787CD56|nr:hypothetical protein [Streptomyces achromogenes]MDQ0831922.1 hypothetical protein [Streptomyces achromogenes]